MCTVSWLASPSVGSGLETYEIFFNRDESRLRQIADPPEVKEHNGVKFLAPTDPDAGGTWLAVNEYGLSVAILNHYQAHQSCGEGPYTSRGKLVISLMDAPSVQEAVARISSDVFTPYRAFILLIFGRNECPQRLLWDGSSLVVDDLEPPMQPITTSSFNPEEVTSRRMTAFSKLVTLNSPSAAELAAFHRHREEDDAYSVCMSRPDALTVSFSRVKVSPEGVRFKYYSDGPGQNSSAYEMSLSMTTEAPR